MSATATTSFKSPTLSQSHSRTHSKSQSQSHSRSSRPSTTPRSQPNVVSVGQSMPPLLNPVPLSSPSKHPKNSSPSYFGFVAAGNDSNPPDSNPGNHARQNWNFPHSNAQSAIPTPRHVALEAHPDFAAFRRQSDHNHRFTLNNSMSTLGRPSQSRTSSISTPRNESAASPTNKFLPVDRGTKAKDGSESQDTQMGGVSFFDMPRHDSPISLAQNSVSDHQHARLSLPMSGTRGISAKDPRENSRSETLPSTGDKDPFSMLSPPKVVELLRNNAKSTLVLDLRVYQHYASSRVKGALNLCIPTTLLKRPAYNVQRLSETFASDTDRDIFDRWPECTHIVVYDANSSLSKEAITSLNVLKKFTTEGWKGTGVVIKGGFLAFSKQGPEFIDSGPVQSAKGAATQPLSMSVPGKDSLPVAGGCAMPSQHSAANPFFGNIRQNMDLLDGVGQMPIKKPSVMTQTAERQLPQWLKRASSTSDEGKVVSDQFLNIEKHEQKRMQEALSTKVSYGTPRGEAPTKIQVAGIEKGSKNRYNNIFPYDHTRVRLQNVPRGDCDYINASHVKAEFSNRQYIASQAPIPATFNDFWRAVWEQDVRVIVMLTAESEGGQVKSHNYWNAGEYGPLKLKLLSERQVNLETKKVVTSKTPAPPVRPSLGARRSTTANVAGERKEQDLKSPISKPPSIMVRHLALSHSSHPFQPMREITQIQYADWPDFGAPASPTELISLVEHVNKFVRRSASPPSTVGPDEAAPEGQRPIMVHCSAGCGRTGTFCTIDSVIDMLKRQRISRGQEHEDDEMDVDEDNSWISRDDVDLVAKTVNDFRHQRLSMVQNLRQFVLCYESVLQWLVGQDSSAQNQGSRRPSLQDSRRSYHG